MKNMETKKELRIKYQTLRNQMTAESCTEYSKTICERILTAEEYRQAKVVYAYYPLGNEASLLPVMEDCLKSGRKLALPKVNGADMDFFQITELSQVEEGCFHVMEPTTTRKVQETQALVLTPGVAFDRTGNRLGYGKGFYDRYFAQYPGLLRMGVAYDCQVGTLLQTQAQDIRMNILVTEREMTEFDA